jgi:hypothetical protein
MRTGRVAAGAGPRRDRREAVPGQRRHDHLDGIRGIAAVRRRIGERRRDLDHLAERARPAVQQDDRRTRGSSAGRQARDVDVEIADPGSVAGEHTVEPLLRRAPVETVHPRVGELPEVRAVDPQLPRDIRGLVRPAGPPDPVDQVVEHRLIDTDVERHQRGGRR